MMFEGTFTGGRFHKRHNRFLADVQVDEALVKVHVPDPGRLKELLRLDAKVLLREELHPHRKTQYDLIGVKTDGVWVEIDSQSTNKLVEEDFNSLPFFSGYKIKRKEVKVHSSRLDFLLEHKRKKKLALVEVKSVTLVEQGVAKFPDAPTSRGTRHVFQLIQALDEGFKPFLLFVVKRHDADVVTVNRTTDPTFAEAVAQAFSHGVQIHAVRCRFALPFLRIEKELPFKL